MCPPSFFYNLAIHTEIISPKTQEEHTMSQILPKYIFPFQVGCLPDIVLLSLYDKGLLIRTRFLCLCFFNKPSSVVSYVGFGLYLFLFLCFAF